MSKSEQNCLIFLQRFVPRGGQYDLFSQIFHATILKVDNGPPERVPIIGFAKSEKSASDLAPGGLYRLKYRKFFQKERHV